jgi:hypothetical protein
MLFISVSGDLGSKMKRRFPQSHYKQKYQTIKFEINNLREIRNKDPIFTKMNISIVIYQLISISFQNNINSL